MKIFKKSLMITSILTLILMLTSCLRSPILPTPFGIWHSENPNLTLFITHEPEHVLRWITIGDGEYEPRAFLVKHVRENGEEIELTLSYSQRPYNFVIFDPTIENPVWPYHIFFSGTHRIHDGRLYLYRGYERTGLETIVFDRVEE